MTWLLLVPAFVGCSDTEAEVAPIASDPVAEFETVFEKVESSVEDTGTVRHDVRETNSLSVPYRAQIVLQSPDGPHNYVLIKAAYAYERESWKLKAVTKSLPDGQSKNIMGKEDAIAFRVP